MSEKKKKAITKVLVYTLKYEISPYEDTQLSEVLEKMGELGHGEVVDVTMEEREIEE